jgi:DNA-directed RNA polymerase subunit M/transcription elongation factor TFIIS
MDSIVGESQRLRERYAALTEDELQAVAGDAFELTEVAQQALQSEILRRGLDICLQQAPLQSTPHETEKFDPADLDLVVIQRAWDSEEARKLMGILHEAGFPCYLGPDNLDDVDAFDSSFDQGVDIKVREVDNQPAQHALSQALPPEPDPDTVYIARCPKCQSTEIVFQGLDQNPATGSAATSSSNFNWTCDACGYQWNDDGIEERSPAP